MATVLPHLEQPTSSLITREIRFPSDARRLYYFDVAGWTVSVLLGIGYVVARFGRQTGFSYKDLIVLSALVLGVVTLCWCRRRAYTQKTPWLVSSFSALAISAIGLVYWTKNVPVFTAATGIGTVMLGGGLALRPKSIDEPLSLHDRFKLASFGVSAVFVLLLMEMALRLVPGAFSPEIQQMMEADPNAYGVAHPYIGHLQSPDKTIVIAGRDFRAVHHVDHLGFRNKWPWPERADIVAIGDSVTFGYGVSDDQAWPSVLSRSLPRARLINLGLIGAGPQQYLRLYETFGVKLHPKVLIVGFFAQNDFWDAGAFDGWLNAGLDINYMVWRDFGRPRRVVSRSRHPIDTVTNLAIWKLYPVIRRSRLYNLLLALRGDTRVVTPDLAPRIFRFADGRHIQLAPSDFFDKVEYARPDSREFQLTLDALRRIRSIGARNGTHVLIALLPGKEEVHLPLLGETTSGMTGALREALGQEEIDYIDLVPAFRQHAAAGEQLFFEADGHPNRAGYALIARLVLSRLERDPEQYGLETLVPPADPSTDEAAVATAGSNR